MNLFESFISDKSIELVNQILKSGFVNQGPMVDLFEKRLAEELWMSNPLTLNSCTSSLHLALVLSGVELGDEVILPPQTFIATGLAVLMAGAIPVFADVNMNGNISLASIREKISPLTKAIICVHWGGIGPPMERIISAVKTIRPDIKIIEDAAHAIGAECDGYPVGSCMWSDFCCFSLQAIKNLTTGDGGILCCRDKEEYEKALRLRWFGMDKKHIVRGPNGERLTNVKELGYKYHMNDISASIGLGNLDTLKMRVNISRAYANLYFDRLKNIEGLYLPLVEQRNDPSYWFFPVRVNKNVRDEVIKKLRERGVPASTVDRRIDNHSIFSAYKTQLIGASYFDESQLALPCHANLTSTDVIYVIDSVKEVMNEVTNS